MLAPWPFRRPALEVTLLGYPFRSTGRGENIRSTFRALRAAGIEPKVFDLAGGAAGEIDVPQIRARLIPRVGRGGIRLFHCNGHFEADQAREAVEAQSEGLFRAGYNIIHPAWELPRYPLKWAQSLNRYNEVWAISKFVHDSLRECITVPLQRYRDACQPTIDRPWTRKDFGLRDEDYLVLSFFDYWSYAARKNPLAAIAAFAAAAKARPNARMRLVMKTNHASGSPEAAYVREAISELGNSAILIDRTMTDNEVKNLIAVSDCLLSLHRSEGFGRGPAEAMFMGKPVIATGWSGNMDYMTPQTSFPVSYQMIPVKEGEYLESEGQVWADPNLEEATRYLLRLVDEPALGPRIGAKAARHMRRRFGDPVVGAAMRRRFHEIVRSGAPT